MEHLREFIKASFEGLHIELSEKQADQFVRYGELLAEWNMVMNLTAITDPQGIAEKHFEDSAALLWKKPDLFCSEKRLIDVGTGAGFPGLPLKILCPDLEVVLLDSLAKRLTFLDTVIAELGLNGIRTIHARAEDGARIAGLRESFDYAVSRAVANLSVLSEYCLPYVKKGGYFIAYKSGDIEEEAAAAEKAIRVLGGGKGLTERFVLPGTDLARSLVICEKKKETPKIYPRKAGSAAQRPIQ